MATSHRTILSLLFCLGLLSSTPNIRVSAQATAAKFKTLDTATLKENANDPSLVLSFNLIRQTPSVFDQDKGFLDSFILLNNCHNPAIENQLKSEFDYPQVASFYKMHAGEILASAPTTITIPIHIDLGSYDTSKSAFPFHAYPLTQEQSALPNSQKQDQNQGLSFDHLDYNSLEVVRSCPLAFNGYADGTGRASIYDLSFSPIVVSGIPMDEASARQYVESLPDARSRPMFLMIEIEIQQEQPRIVATPGRRTTVAFSGMVKRITAVDKYPGGRIFATLEPGGEAQPNHSNPVPATAAASSANATTVNATPPSGAAQAYCRVALSLVGQATMDSSTGKMTLPHGGLEALRKCVALVPNGYYGTVNVKAILDEVDGVNKAN